jgi:hypothetical protein
MRDAFVAGYAPSAASPYYNGLTLLAEASRAADPNLLRQIGDESDQVVERRDEAFTHVDRTADALAALGVPSPAPPPEVADYPEWVEAVFDAVNGAIRPGSADAVAHLLGHVLGEGMATLDALAIVWRLREAAPDHMLLRIQGSSLENERATAERRLGRLASHPLLPAAVQTATASAAHRITNPDSFRDEAHGLAEVAWVIESAL